MQKKTSVFLSCLIAGLILCIIFFAAACDKDEPTAPVSFKPPGTYNGIYRVVKNWNTKDSTWSQANVTFNFKANDSFFMWVNSTAEGYDFHLCSVNGVYLFRRDTLTLEINNRNLNQQICDQSVGPEGALRHFVDQDYLVFELRGNTYRKIEFPGK